MFCCCQRNQRPGFPGRLHRPAPGRPDRPQADQQHRPDRPERTRHPRKLQRPLRSRHHNLGPGHHPRSSGGLDHPGPGRHQPGKNQGRHPGGHHQRDRHTGRHHIQAGPGPVGPGRSLGSDRLRNTVPVSRVDAAETWMKAKPQVDETRQALHEACDQAGQNDIIAGLVQACSFKPRDN